MISANSGRNSTNSEPSQKLAFPLRGGDLNYSIFHRKNRKLLQKAILDGEIDSDELLPHLLDYIDVQYYNLFCNLDTGEHSASPVSRRGNAQFAWRQERKRNDLKKILKGSVISKTTPQGTFSHLFLLTLTIDQNLMTRDEANHFITTQGRGIADFFARLEKQLDLGYSKVIVKESTTSGYPAVHVLLRFDTPLKVKRHRKSNTYRPDPSDPYTKKILGKLKNLNDWNSCSPLWGVGFIDIYGFTNDDLSVKGHSNFVDYMSKYITKSLDLSRLGDISAYKRVSDLPEKYRTAVWTILNNLIWNSQTWVISKSFKEKMKELKEKTSEIRERWMWVDTVHKDSPRLFEWMGYDLSKELPKPPSIVTIPI